MLTEKKMSAVHTQQFFLEIAEMIMQSVHTK